MILNEIMKELETFGTAQTKKVLANHGAREPFFGVKVEDLKKIVKKLQTYQHKHMLALELYATGNSDAMYLAGLLADPKLMGRETLNGWVLQAYFPMLSEYTVAWMTAESPIGWEVALDWIGSSVESVAASGWSALSGIVALKPDNHLDINKIRELIRKIEKEIHQSPDRVRSSMNGFIISAGSYVSELTGECKAAGAAIGMLKSTAGGKPGKPLPYAPDYIAKVEAAGRIGRKKSTVVC